MNPQAAGPAQVGFLSRERNEWNGRAWRMPEILLVPVKPYLATVQRLLHPKQVAQIEQLWKVSASVVLQRLYIGGGYIVCQVANT